MASTSHTKRLLAETRQQMTEAAPVLASQFGNAQPEFLLGGTDRDMLLQNIAATCIVLLDVAEDMATEIEQLRTDVDALS